jgi:hypothetical protein
MRRYLITTCCLLATSASSFAQPSDEECKRSVDATLQALDQHSKQSGNEERLRDLSAKDIRALQKSDGNCAALAQINKRKTRW